ncbi:MAG: FHA domain-containing protein [Anaerolineae bacterium]
MKHDAVALDHGPTGGMLGLVAGLVSLPTVQDGTQALLSGWALAFILVGALGLLLLLVLVLAWQIARRRRRLSAAMAPAEPDTTPEAPPAPAGPAAWGALWVRQPGAPVQVFPLTEPAISIGRDPDSGLWLDDGLLSERHAELRHEAGAGILYDLGSSGGISVNHAQITGSRRLSPGDVIHLGQTELVYRPPSRAAGSGGRLVTTGGHSEPSDFDLFTRRELYLGQSSSCDIVIEGDPGVSRRHALLQRTAGGHEIVDLESGTGVLVNGRPVSRAHLRPGDQIRLGATEFLYER